MINVIDFCLFYIDSYLSHACLNSYQNNNDINMPKA